MPQCDNPHIYYGEVISGCSLAFLESFALLSITVHLVLKFAYLLSLFTFCCSLRSNQDILLEAYDVAYLINIVLIYYKFHTC